MKEENIMKIAVDKNVKEKELFVKFLSLAFPEEDNRITSYFEEWADRFNTGKPEIYMDNWRLDLYNKLVRE